MLVIRDLEESMTHFRGHSLSIIITSLALVRG